ncbi:PREDICTED: uncharacterized protein LOC109208081 [Nicotiana attenuata]|uniref:uncharacterized protein LOC109208081 n=1 Tax=Nicotiana attenuata TaxID=49451 RepID=UPI00090519BB|nr:PREDICTED: uncharacterized protein LOC109208081 [Nicotiana attenuata]
MTTARSLIAIAAKKKWEISQLDVNNAFLHGDLHEEVYMQAPPGLEVHSPGKLVGKLNFLTNTRLDITYGVQHLSQFIQDPREPHLHAAYHMLRYPKKDPTLGLYFSNVDDLSATAYCDSDLAAYPDSRRSISGYLVFLGGSLVSWKSKK